MSIFRRLLVLNFLTFLLLSMALVASYSVLLAQHVSDMQKGHAKTLRHMVSTQLELEPKQLAKELKQAFDYSQLSFTENGGSSLYDYEDNGAQESFSFLLLNALGLMPEGNRVSINETGLNIHYKLRFKAEFKLFDLVFYASLSAIFVVLILLSITIRIFILRLVRRTVHNISNVLNEHNTDSIEHWNGLPEEFRPLTESLDNLQHNYENKLQQWKDSADSYRVEATSDELTGLKNRISFVEYFEDKLIDLDSLDFGILAVTRATELNNVNQNRGYQAGDEYITQLAQLVERAANTYQGAQVYRLNGSDFAVVIPGSTAKDAENYALNLQGRLGELQQALELDSIAYTGIVTYESGRPLGELLALTDTGVSIAQTKYANAWHIQSDTSVLDNVSAKYGTQNWREVIDDVTDNGRAILFFQPIQPTANSSKVYSEVLARFANSEEQILPTASFIAMAEKMDKIVVVDKMIIDQTMRTIQERGLNEQYFGLNVTAKSAHDEQFSIWLERRLLRDPSIASQLIFEVTEFGMQQNMTASRRFLDMIHRTGARVTVERFGMGMTSFKFFRNLKPDFIKIDGSYSRGIDDDKNNQYFLRVIIDLAHRLGVKVIAESVETQEEKHTLEQLFIDGTQGYFIGKPVEF